MERTTFRPGFYLDSMGTPDRAYLTVFSGNVIISPEDAKKLRKALKKFIKESEHGNS
jgi:hypothetical protein